MSTINGMGGRVEVFLPRSGLKTEPVGELESLWPAVPEKKFNIFNPDHLGHALDLATDFMVLANAKPNDAGSDGREALSPPAAPQLTSAHRHPASPATQPKGTTS